MKNDDKRIIDSMSNEELLAYRKVFIMMLNSNEKIPVFIIDEIKDIIKYIETKLNNNHVSLNTPVSQSDIEKARKYMGGFSGINNSQSNYNKRSKDIDGGDVAPWLVGAGIVLSLISSFFNWVGQVLTDLWSKGIIQMILGAIGLGGLGYGVYILNENGSFDEIKKYFEKKKIERIRAKKEKSISKAKIHEKKVSKSEEQEEKFYNHVKRFNVTAVAIMVLAYSSYHLADNLLYNGQRISIYKTGRLEDKQYYPQFEFSFKPGMLFKTKDASKIMEECYNSDNVLHYELRYYLLTRLASYNMYYVYNYIHNDNFNGEPCYYYLHNVLEPFLDSYDKDVVKMFNDYRNAIVYYAASDMRDELYDTIKYFYIDAYWFFQKGETYQLGNPIHLRSYKYKDISPLAKEVILQISRGLLDIKYPGYRYITCLGTIPGTGCVVDVEELSEFIDEEIIKVRDRNKNKTYTKF